MNEKARFVIQRAGVHSLHALAYLALLSLSAEAGGPFDCLLARPGPVPDCIGKWCPDDYCAKKEPRVCVPLCFGCDDYCSKKAPCVCAPLCFGCDDYCKKCPPKVCSGPLCQFLRCGSSCQPCSGVTCDTYAANHFEVKKRLRADDDEQLVHRSAPKKPQLLPPVFVGASEFKLTK